MRENSFDMIEVIAGVHEDTMRRMHTGFDPEHFNTGLYNPQLSPTPRSICLGYDRQGREFEAGMFAFAATPAATLLPLQSLAKSMQQPCSISRMTTDASKMERKA